MEGEFIIWPTGRVSSLWEPLWRFTLQPMRSSAARTRFVLLAGQLLIGDGERNVQGRRWQFPVGNSVGNYLDCKSLSVADSFVPSLPVTHHPWQLQGFRDPPAIFFPIQVNR
jgi:hypothetical protein